MQLYIVTPAFLATSLFSSGFGCHVVNVTDESGKLMLTVTK